MSTLAEVLAWKYGPVACTKQVDPNDTNPNPEMYISAWNHATLPQPDAAQIAIDTADYENNGLKEKRKALCKIEANRRIVSVIPEWKQRNYTARSLELTEKKADGLVLTAGEQAEIDGIKAIWSQVVAIRAASDLIEAEIDLDVNYDYLNSPLWP